MRGRLMVLVTTLLLFAAALVARGEVATATMMAQADAAYAQFEFEQAAVLYGRALSAGGDRYEAAWKRARALVDLGDQPGPADQRRENYREAEKMARLAVVARPDGGKGHLYLSIAIGKMALEEGPRERVRLSKEVKNEVDRALAIDQADDVAWHVLGRWHRRLAQLSWVEKRFADIFLGGVPKEAKVETAADCFRRAISLNPEHLHHHLELALTLEEMGSREGAAEEYRKVLSLREKVPRDREFKATARERLRGLRDR